MMRISFLLTTRACDAAACKTGTLVPGTGTTGRIRRTTTSHQSHISRRQYSTIHTTVCVDVLGVRTYLEKNERGCETVCP
jgi:hypothetical protein